MRSRTLRLRPALVALLVTGAVGLTVGSRPPPATAGVDPVPVAGAQTYEHLRVQGLGGDAAGDLVLLAGHPDGDGYQDTVEVVTRSGSGAWGQPVRLDTPVVGSALRSTSASLAIADDGTGVVVWDDQSATGHASLWARTRTADGTWSAPARIGHSGQIFGPSQVVAVAGGRAAVGFLGGGAARPRAAVWDGGGWSVTPTPRGGGFTPTLSLNARGVLHAALKSDPHGGGGRVLLTRLRPGSDHWATPRAVRTPYLSSDPVRLVTDGSGRERLLVGYVAGHRWRTPGDGDYVGATAWRVLGPRTVVWDRRGAGSAVLSVDGDGTRVTWQQWRGVDAHRRPLETRLRTQVLGASDVTTLASTDRRGWVVSAAGGKVGALAWLPVAGPQRPLLGVSVDGADAGTLRLVADDVEGPGSVAFGGAVSAVADGRAWVAWGHDVIARTDNGAVQDADLSVAPLG